MLRCRAHAALAAALAATAGTLELPGERPDSPGGTVPVRTAGNPAGAKLRQLLVAALDQAPDYRGTLPLLTRLEPAAVSRVVGDLSAG